MVGGRGSGLERARALARAGERERASAVLAADREALAASGDGPLLRRAVALARRIGDDDLELHLALALWSTERGSSTAATTLTGCVALRERAPAAAYRIMQRVGRVEDWLAIAEADRLGVWPAIEAACAPGRLLRRDDLERSGVLRSAAPGTSGAWALTGARLTCAGRSVAVGAHRGAGEQMSLVPALSTWDPSAALGWYEQEPAQHHRRLVLLATGFRFSGYWHWLMEGLAGAVHLDAVGLVADADALVVAVDAPPPPFVLDSLAACGLDPDRVVTTERGLDVTVDELVLPARHRLAGMILEDGDVPTLDDAFREHADREQADGVAALRRRLGVEVADRRPARRLYVSRAPARRRRIVNEDELVAALGAFGVERVVLEGRPFRDQVELFADATVVVAPHGAGLANLAFCSPATAVVEVQPAGRALPHFARLAGHIGARHHAVTAPVVDGGTDDMVVDVEEVVRAVRLAVEGGT